MGRPAAEAVQELVRRSLGEAGRPGIRRTTLPDPTSYRFVYELATARFIGQEVAQSSAFSNSAVLP
jgi:hypothetical protein